MNLVDTIVNSFNSAIGDLVAALPAIISALLLLIIGWIIAGFAGRVVRELLQRAGVDRLFAQHAGQVYGPKTQQFSLSRIAGLIVTWVLRIVFLVAAANLLGLPQLSAMVNQVILWLPNLLVAVIILMLAPVLGRIVRGAIEASSSSAGFSSGSLMGRIAEIAIIAFAVIIAVNQVGIAANLINILFTGLVLALSIAVGLAFGLGGRNVAEQVTQSWYDKSKEASQKISQAAQQSQSSVRAQPSASSRIPPPPPAPGTTATR